MQHCHRLARMRQGPQLQEPPFVPQINCDTRTEEDAYTGVLTKQHYTSEDLAAALRMRLASLTCVVTFCRERKEGWKHDMRHHVIYQISSIHFKFVLPSALAVQPISMYKGALLRGRLLPLFRCRRREGISSYLR